MRSEEERHFDSNGALLDSRLQERWDNTPHDNETLRDCVHNHIQKLIDKQPIYKLGSKAPLVMDGFTDNEPTVRKQERKLQETESLEQATQNTHDLRLCASHATERIDLESLVTITDIPLNNLKPQQIGKRLYDRLCTTLDWDHEPDGAATAAESDDTHADGEDAGATEPGDDTDVTHPSDEASGNSSPDPAAAHRGGGNTAGEKGKGHRGGYNWLLFAILAIIAGILVFIVIPILLIMIVAKYGKAKSASKRKAGKKGQGKGKSQRSKSTRSKSSTGTKSKSMQSKSH
ncbi:hypothetical protein ANCDUO_11246 [Ancylostoma duodenale]|uniref:Uncharacterized protein n=1 Tax=Ancylostoma duodenale TaxID=51022 RepID=A0A0C2D8Q9_9BILA|nr:hypothetical protein ANCDUO_11246 [Ancylostoma duodenale]